MSQVYTFHETVRGHLHIMNELPCEDASASYSSEDGKYHIAIVADGHGSKSCFRSNLGSKIATEVAMECLRQFAEQILVSEESEHRFYQDVFSSSRNRQMTIRRLTDTILARWHDRVTENYENDPPSADEMGECVTEYEIAHIYGTTLIAALQMPMCLVLIHQGDGRCDVFFSDGSVDQPIPWDDRCEDTATTSLCDEDAADRFRSFVLDLSEKPVMACYLGCDGVEDAYRDTYEDLGDSHVLMGGVHTFYKYLTYTLAEMGQAEFKSSLEKMFSEFSEKGKFSRSGSGDDVSVAGIVDLDVISQFVVQYKYEVNRYSLEEKLFWKVDELRGKTRKHGILKKRVEEIQAALHDARTTQQSLESRLKQRKMGREELGRKVEQAKTDWEGCLQELQTELEHFEGRSIIYFCVFSQRYLNAIKVECSQKEAVYQKNYRMLLKVDEQIKKDESARIDQIKIVKELEEKLAEAQAAFTEYDAKYQAIDADRIRFEEQIAALQEENGE